MYKAYTYQDDLQGVAHKTNTCGTICMANETTYTAETRCETVDAHGPALARSGSRVDDDLHG